MIAMLVPLLLVEQRDQAAEGGRAKALGGDVQDLDMVLQNRLAYLRPHREVEKVVGN
jgi:hypothetical protein